MKKAQERVSDDEITVFKSVGIAVQDVACANYVYHEAIKEGIGKEMANFISE